VLKKRLGVEPLFSRQVAVLGARAHERLSRTVFAVVGAGGIGSHSAFLLAQAGAREVRVIDRDVVEESNLARQCLYCRESLGKPKAFEAAASVSRLGVRTLVKPFFEQFSPSSAAKLLSGVDVVLDCSDNYETRAALNEFCWQKKMPWVYSAAAGFRVMASAVVPGRTPCFACWSTGESMKKCVEGVMNTAVAFASALQVQAAIDLACTGTSALNSKLFFADLRKALFFLKPLSKKRDCRVCGVT